jgi:predicted kinase
MCGLPLTGKTTAARWLVAETGATLLSTDGLRRELFEQCTLEHLVKSKEPIKYDLQRIFDPLPSIPDNYQQLIWKQSDLVYEEVMRRTPVLLSRNSVVLDGSFSRRRAREEVYSAAKLAGHRPYLIHCVASEEVISKRLKKRASSTEDLSYVVTMDVYLKVKERFEDPASDSVAMLRYDSGNGNIVIRNAQLGSQIEIATIERVLRTRAAEHR